MPIGSGLSAEVITKPVTTGVSIRKVKMLSGSVELSQEIINNGKEIEMKRKRGIFFFIFNLLNM